MYYVNNIILFVKQINNYFSHYTTLISIKFISTSSNGLNFEYINIKACLFIINISNFPHTSVKHVYYNVPSIVFTSYSLFFSRFTNRSIPNGSQFDHTKSFSLHTDLGLKEVWLKLPRCFLILYAK